MSFDAHGIEYSMKFLSVIVLAGKTKWRSETFI